MKNSIKNLRDLLDHVYLVYYVVIDTSIEYRSKKFYYSDIIFKNYSSAVSYVRDAEKVYNGFRDYYIVSVPII